MSSFQLDELTEILTDINVQREDGNIHFLPTEENRIRFIYIINEIVVWCNLPNHVHGKNGIAICFQEGAFVVNFNTLLEFKNNMCLTLECLGWDDELEHMIYVPFFMDHV
jgi:hypothetical protein